MSSFSRQRGAAALSVTLLLLFVLTLVVGFAGRHLMFEQRAAANQVRSTQAFEAAEAGLAWAQAMLNRPAAVDEHCAPVDDAGQSSFRDRMLAYDAASQQYVPRTWNDDGQAVALHAACVFDADGWRCSCPATGAPALAAPAATGTHPAFAVRLVAVPRRGLVQLVVTGCDRYAPACLPGSPVGPAGDATAQLQVLLGLLPALATLPAAALTVRGDAVADGALVLVNDQSEGTGLAVQAGGAVGLPRAMLTTSPGRTPAEAVAADDETLAGTPADRLLTRLLGVDLLRWLQLPTVQRLDCPADCTAALTAATAAPGALSSLHVAGDLVLEGGATFGDAERPLLLVVDGAVRLRGGVRLHGVVISRSASWDTHGSADARIDGALVALGEVVGDGSATIVHDEGVLSRLGAQAGSFVVVPGSWRDF